jgi:two-component system response regulator NreC
MGRKIQVAVIDVPGLMREGLCALLSGREELEVAGALGGDPREISTAPIAAPDVALLEISTAGQAEFAAVAALKKRWPAVHILVLASVRDRPPADTAQQAGIAGYVCKSSSQGELLSAIRSVSVGGRPPASNARERPEEPPPSAPPQSSLARRGPRTLSDREREVMRLIAEGYRTREMAKQLSLSHKTIEKHRSNLMRKLGLRSATAVAAYAISHGYVVLAI